MRIKGPTNGAPPVAGVDEVGEVAGSDGATSTGAVGSSAPVGQAGAAGPVDAVAEVAAQLRAGQISVDQAVDRLIDDAIQRQLGALGQGGHLGQSDQARDLEPKLRELLRSYAESDPFLAARIRKLTLAK